jgi:hypothetical protein
MLSAGWEQGADERNQVSLTAILVHKRMRELRLLALESCATQDAAQIVCTKTLFAVFINALVVFSQAPAAQI